MHDFSDQDLQGARFDRARLRGARFTDADLSGAQFRAIDLTGASITHSDLVDVRIEGELLRVTINGVDVAPLVEAELDRRHPHRADMRPTDPDGFRAAWDIVERLWAGTVERARSLDPELLHVRVEGEWSFVETLRHLAFATDAWIRRAVLGDPTPWDPLDLPFDELGQAPPGVPWDRAVRPALDEVLALRADRMATVRAVVDALTEEQLASETEPVPGDSWPRPVGHPVRKCLLIVLNEEFQHRLYAERDLDALAPPTAAPGERSPG